MWAKLDDGFLDHRKVFVAGEKLGRNGPAIAIGFFSVGLMYANKHLTNGHLPKGVVRRFPHVENPLGVARALVDAGLWETAPGGYQIHDFNDHNPQASEVLAKRKRDRERKQLGGRNRHASR
jgi:hypothetical protein